MAPRSANIIFIILTLLVLPAWSQQENRYIRQGNRDYEEGKYKEAEIGYLKSMQAKNASHKGVFNLGNALYMQNDYPRSAAAFDSLRTLKMGENERADAYYNLGNSLLKVSTDSAHASPEALQSSIQAYKQSLRIDPSDQDAKYNLAYAQRLLKQQQQQQQQQNQQQNQQNEEDQQQQQDSGEQERTEQQEQGKQQQGQPQQISREDAQRILEALKNDEKQTLEKLKLAKIQNTRVIKTDKDW
jgi:hypothetical protein